MAGDETPREVALARDVERAVRAANAAVARVAEVDGGLDAVAGRLGEVEQMLRDLSESVTQLIAASEPVRSWILADDAEAARAALVDLAEWLERVYLRYPDTELSPCWAWHPAVVEELLALRHLHREAYRGKSWERVGEWHDRWLPGVRERIHRDVGSCGLDLHGSGKKRGQPPAVTPMARHLDAIVDSWMSTGLPPEPTTDQLVEAQEHEDQRTNRDLQPPIS